MKTKCGIQKGNGQRKDSCSQMHSASVKFVPVTELINETSVHTPYNCDQFWFWWENPKSYFYFKVEKAASFSQKHSTGQSLVSLEGVLFHRLPPLPSPQPLLSLVLAEVMQKCSMICNQLPPSTKKYILFFAKVPLIYQIVFLNFIWQRKTNL